jgi:hypothetical protein
LTIFPPPISIITHPIAKAFGFQSILILNLTQTSFQYGNSETKHNYAHQVRVQVELNHLHLLYSAVVVRTVKFKDKFFYVNLTIPTTEDQVGPIHETQPYKKLQ